MACDEIVCLFNLLGESLVTYWLAFNNVSTLNFGGTLLICAGGAMGPEPIETKARVRANRCHKINRVEARNPRILAMNIIYVVIPMSLTEPFTI